MLDKIIRKLDTIRNLVIRLNRDGSFDAWKLYDGGEIQIAEAASMRQVLVSIKRHFAGSHVCAMLNVADGILRDWEKRQSRQNTPFLKAFDKPSHYVGKKARGGYSGSATYK